MKLKQIFLELLQRETAVSRRVVAHVPEGRNDWKPHERSMTLGYLAGLVAGMPGWAEFMVNREELDLGHGSAEAFKTRVMESTADLLRKLDDGYAASRKALESTTDARLLERWRFVMDGDTLFEAPRYIALNESLFCHMAHHRGQLTVYLRLNGAKVPAIYGPSADEIR